MKTSLEPHVLTRHNTWIEIRLDRLLENFKALQGRAGADCSLLCVIKANAYGHGASKVAKILAPQARYLGVASAEEALRLREAHILAPLFIFGRPLSHELPEILLPGITLTVSDLPQALEISEESEKFFRKTPVHVKVDTGMGRMGIPLGEAHEKIMTMKKLPGIKLEGIYTHFPSAESDDGFRDLQVESFRTLLENLRKEGMHFCYYHAANSAGILKSSPSLLNMARPGLSLYGVYPDLSLKTALSLTPILSLKTRIVFFKELEEGQSAGYGREYVAQKKTRLAILPFGYSHGYPVKASSRAKCLFHGKRFPIAGRVSMDYLAIDLGEEPAHVGDIVTLIGEEQGECVTIEELAQHAETIPYEILTRLPTHLPRLYSGDFPNKEQGAPCS